MLSDDHSPMQHGMKCRVVWYNVFEQVLPLAGRDTHLARRPYRYGWRHIDAWLSRGIIHCTNAFVCQGKPSSDHVQPSFALYEVNLS